MRVELLGISKRTETAVGDPAQTCLHQPQAREHCEIAAEMAGTVAWLERRKCEFVARDKGFAHFGAHFERWLANTWPDPRCDASWRMPHLCNCRFEYAGSEAAPARMRGGDDTAIVSGKHDGQAVGGQDCEHPIRLTGNRSIRLGQCVLREPIGIDHGNAVHLPQPQRITGQCHCAAQGGTIVRHGEWIITDVIPQIEAIMGR